MFSYAVAFFPKEFLKMAPGHILLFANFGIFTSMFILHTIRKNNKEIKNNKKKAVKYFIGLRSRKCVFSFKKYK